MSDTDMGMPEVELAVLKEQVAALKSKDEADDERWVRLEQNQIRRDEKMFQELKEMRVEYLAGMNTVNSKFDTIAKEFEPFKEWMNQGKGKWTMTHLLTTILAAALAASATIAAAVISGATRWFPHN